MFLVCFPGNQITNIEQGIMNVEGQDDRIIRNSLFGFSFLKNTFLCRCVPGGIHTQEKQNPFCGKKARRAEMIIELWADKMHNPEGVK